LSYHEPPLSKVIDSALRFVVRRLPPSLRVQLMHEVQFNRSRPVVAVRSVLERRAARRWQTSGGDDSPPPYVKHNLIREYRRRFATPFLVETGTFLGDSIYALRRDFDRIISIELDPALAARARRRFARESHVSILFGDSAHVLPTVLAELKEPTLFWLDAHWSGGATAHGEKETPILEEVDAILRHPVDGHVVLIDDARFLGRRQDYPPFEALCTTTNRLKPGWVCEIGIGIARLHVGALDGRSA
jgi:hypothetical protein